MSAYFLFMNDRRVSLKKEQPELKFGDITKTLTKEWNAMTDKSKFEKMFEADKERYQREMKELGIESKETKKENAVKKPLSAYMVFAKENRA
jgi:hypothetical protein